MAVTRDHLRDYFMHAEDKAVYHAYPRHVASNLNAGYRDTLSALADSVLLGDLVLHWEVECPFCHGQGAFAEKLNEAPAGAMTCGACGGGFTPHLDEEVFVTFSPHPALRKLGPGAADSGFHQDIATQYAQTNGHELLTIQTFRDWAQNEPLPPGVSLEVQRVALLFTDLSGSTALYLRRGDPRAYQLVSEHFDALFEAIDGAGGSVVKTIGDGTMAVFIDSASAVKAAIDGHAALEQFNRAKNVPPDDRLRLKAGVHAGPSILVTLNERLDYFGQTVNLAARVQEVARPGDVAISQVVYEDAAARRLIEGYMIESAQFDLRGFDEPVTVNRFPAQREVATGME